jgi:hypothetical protein
LLARCFAELFYDPEDGGDAFLRNVGYHSTHYTASYPRRSYSYISNDFIFISQPPSTWPAQYKAHSKILMKGWNAGKDMSILSHISVLLIGLLICNRAISHVRNCIHHPSSLITNRPVPLTENG